MDAFAQTTIIKNPKNLWEILNNFCVNNGHGTLSSYINNSADFDETQENFFITFMFYKVIAYRQKEITPNIKIENLFNLVDYALFLYIPFRNGFRNRKSKNELEKDIKELKKDAKKYSGIKSIIVKDG